MGIEKLLKTLEGHSDGVLSLAFSPSGALLASGSEDNTVKIWKMPDALDVKTIPAHSGNVTSVAFFPDGNSLASAGWDKTVKVWSLPDLAMKRSFGGHASPVNRVAVHKDGAVLITASDDQTVRLWSDKTGSQLAELNPEMGDVKALAVSPDGQILAAGGTELKFLTFPDGNLLKANSDYIYGVRALAFSPDGKRLAAALGMEKKLELWALNSGEISLEGAFKDSDWINCAAFSPDGRFLFTGGSAVKKWDLASGQAVETFEGHSDEIYSVAVSPEGKMIASASNDKTIKLWSCV